jgi:hypothetical protein
MNYEELIETISEIVENDKIFKPGLKLVYELSEDNHKKMDEHLFYTSNPESSDFEHNEVIEVVISGILIQLVKK